MMLERRVVVRSMIKEILDRKAMIIGMMERVG